jgi:predicted HicB family RNase H-like nuclease
MNKLVYKGYTAKIEFDPEENELVGEIEGIKDLVVFSSKNCDEMEKNFHESVDGYLESCKMAGKDPDKAYTGSFNIRIDPEDHRQLDLLARKENTTLNSEIKEAVKRYLKEKMINN